MLVLTMHPQSMLWAQASPDVYAPVIDLDALASSQADNTQVFSARVTDDRELEDVILFHRRAGQAPFQRTVMEPIGSTEYFSASISTDVSDLRTIEYYLQARDASGNRSVEGYAFDPYGRSLSANKLLAQTPVSTTFVTDNNTNASSRGGIKWWHIALGVLAAGAIASSASSSGSDNGTSNTGNTAPITISISGPR